MKKRDLLLLLVCILSIQTGIVHPQKLSPGFNKAEYTDLLKLYSRQGDSSYYKDISASRNFHIIYRSEVVGMDNRWDLSISKDSVAVIGIRGTTASSVSWMENFYAAMVPAKGRLLLKNNRAFDYQLASHPQAAVHTGWLTGMAYMAEDIVARMDSCYRNGIREFIVMGHSQGGAIAFLLTSHLYHLRISGNLPANIVIKTYCSAAPKPGNLYYAYEYEAATQAGWSYTVVNAADWVPETPISIQTLEDFNTTNPFTDAKKAIKKLKFPLNLYMNHIYNQLNKSTQKAKKKYQKYLGKMMAKLLKSYYSENFVPVYAPSNNYIRTGNFVILMPDQEYYRLFPDSRENLFVHHMLEPYLYLAEKLPE